MWEEVFVVFFVTTLFLLASYNTTFSGRSRFGGSCVDGSNAITVGKVFIFLVFLNRTVACVSTANAFSLPCIGVRQCLSRVIISVFFFCSNFKVVRRVGRENKTCVNAVPGGHFPRLLLGVSVYIILFVVLGTTVNRAFNTGRVLLSFVN